MRADGGEVASGDARVDSKPFRPGSFESRDIERSMPSARPPYSPVHTFAAAIAALALIASASGSAAEAGESWKLSVAVGPAFALGKAADRWAKLIDERSGGKPPV